MDEDFRGLKGVIYCRSIPTIWSAGRVPNVGRQMGTILNWCERQGIVTPFDFYYDHKDERNPAWRRLRSDIADGTIKPDMIICDRMERITPGTPKDFLRKMRGFEDVPFLFVHPPMGSSSHAYLFSSLDPTKLMRFVMDAFQFAACTQSWLGNNSIT